MFVIAMRCQVMDFASKTVTHLPYMLCMAACFRNGEHTEGVFVEFKFDDLVRGDCPFFSCKFVFQNGLAWLPVFEMGSILKVMLAWARVGFS